MKSEGKSGCGTNAASLGCCKVESLVSVDERGQMVLPKDIRDKANIRAGDKLAIVTWEKDGKVCCLSLIKSDEFAGMVRDLLGPMMGVMAEDKNI